MSHPLMDETAFWKNQRLIFLCGNASTRIPTESETTATKLRKGFVHGAIADT
jgi:hypothetical protein